MEHIMDRRTFVLSTLGFAAGVAAIGMTAKTAKAMTLVVPRSAPLLLLVEWIEQAPYWGGDDEDWPHRRRWHGDEDDYTRRMMTTISAASGGGIAAASGPRPDSSLTSRHIDLKHDFAANPPRRGELLNERCVL